MKRLTFLTLFIALFLSIDFSVAQDQDVKLTLQPGHEMKIDGDANVRSWDAEVKTINADFVMRAFDMNDLSGLTSDHFKTMKLTIPVDDIESDSGRLTRNLQGYLKGDEYPQITFTLNEIDSVQIEGNNATISASGVINAAGVDYNTTMTVNATFNGNSVTFSGEQELLMTDFNIDPPTAVLGTIRAHDEIKIPYTLTFSL